MSDNDFTAEISSSGDNQAILRMGGVLHFPNIEQVRREVTDLAVNAKAGEIVINLEEVSRFDSSAAAMIAVLMRDLDKHEKKLSIGEVSEAVKPLLNLADFEELLKDPEPATWRHRSTMEVVGDWSLGRWGETSEMLQYVGRVVISLVFALGHPRRVRWGQVVFLVQSTGADALPIVALISYLIGLVIAFVSAIQLQQFGANIFIADLVGLAIFREMGPLMAAIMVTARSGSAFAAELGTMKISEEVDALTMMGVKPLEYLVIPRLLAVMISLPLLTCFADFFGILGGLTVAMTSLDVTMPAFYQQMQGVIGIWDITSGILKSFFFGMLIAAAGCYYGMSTSGGALGVGRSTTKSVVAGVFLIVVADSIFVVLFQYLGLS